MRSVIYSQASITKDQLARAMTGGMRAGTFGDIVVAFGE